MSAKFRIYQEAVQGYMIQKRILWIFWMDYCYATSLIEARRYIKDWEEDDKVCGTIHNP
jgi:hypothetical protein